MSCTRSVLLLAAALCLLSFGDGAAFSSDIQAVTRPSADVTLSFVQPGKIAEVLVKEGQLVKPAKGEAEEVAKPSSETQPAGQAGPGKEEEQVLVRQDDSAEQKRLAQLEAQADSRVRIDAAKAQLEQKKVDLEKIRLAAEKGAATNIEVDHAKLDVTIAELSLELAEFEHKQDRLKYEEMKLQIERMKLVSPIEGIVESIFVEAGESVDSHEKVIRLVKIDPLWVEVNVPLAQAGGLKVKQGASVSFGSADGAVGKITHIGSVADPASETIPVRVEVANPKLRRAGERVRVSFEPAGSDTP
ncbi:MAG TPA: efflux RND transporter periplasmic adaptor subunit [Phycisphaerae bacterium]|nr:efflux RND transporter periplasmic adaptor subunit [Phycisphaerae bacterium]